MKNRGYRLPSGRASVAPFFISTSKKFILPESKTVALMALREALTQCAILTAENEALGETIVKLANQLHEELII